MTTSSTLGERLAEAFGTNDKEIIAKGLGFETKRAVYKVINGDRELDFEKLINFHKRTKCSINWLLTGEGEKFVADPGTALHVDKNLVRRIETIAREQTHVIFSDVDIAGGNAEEATLRLLVRFLINRALASFNLAREGEYLSAADRKSAERFTFLANIPESLDDRVRDIIRRELPRPLEEESLRELMRELVREEVGSLENQGIFPLEETRRRKAG